MIDPSILTIIKSVGIAVAKEGLAAAIKATFAGRKSKPNSAEINREVESLIQRATLDDVKTYDGKYQAITLKVRSSGPVKRAAKKAPWKASAKKSARQASSRTATRKSTAKKASMKSSAKRATNR